MLWLPQKTHFYQNVKQELTSQYLLKWGASNNRPYISFILFRLGFEHQNALWEKQKEMLKGV